jgi:hypothetical protein
MTSFTRTATARMPGVMTGPRPPPVPFGESLDSRIGLVLDHRNRQAAPDHFLGLLKTTGDGRIGGPADDADHVGGELRPDRHRT